MMTRRRLAALTGGAVTLSVLVLAAPATEAAVFSGSSSTLFTISTGAAGPASPGSTVIKLYGAATTISDVDVTLTGVTHTKGDDLDILLVSPDGTGVILMSDVCGAGGGITGTNVTLDDSAANLVPPGGNCATGSYKPNNVDITEIWNPPNPGISLAAFNGENANGEWTLFVNDDTTGNGGAISGWSLSITTTADAALAIPSAGSTDGAGKSSHYPLSIPVSGLTGQVADVNLVLPGLSHRAPNDLDILLVSPTGATALVMSDACGVPDAVDVTLTIDDQAPAAMPVAGGCASGSYKPTDFGLAETMDPSAPAGPYGTTMATFNGTSPNGFWKLYVRDDGANLDTGWLLTAPTLQITTTGPGGGGGGGNSAPETTVTKKPKSSTKTSAKVTFTSSEASTFECKLDKKKWKSCTSPFKAKHLKVGKHKVQVRATDLTGLVDGTPAKVTWKVRPRR